MSLDIFMIMDLILYALFIHVYCACGEKAEPARRFVSAGHFVFMLHEYCIKFWDRPQK